MTSTATALRKDLFKILDSVVQGEPAVITYKGAVVRLEPPAQSSKLARAVKRDTLLVDPDSIIGSDEELMQELHAQWGRDDKLL
jgi:prevent-host-death family protein